MDKGCQCSSYYCDCYKPSNIPDWNESELLLCLLQVESTWDTDSIKTKAHSKEYLDRAIKILKGRGRKEIINEI